MKQLYKGLLLVTSVALLASFLILTGCQKDTSGITSSHASDANQQKTRMQRTILDQRSKGIQSKREKGLAKSNP